MIAVHNRCKNLITIEVKMSKKDKAEPVNFLSLTENEVTELVDKTLKKLSKKVHLISPGEYDLVTSISSALLGCWAVSLQRASVIDIFHAQPWAPMTTSLESLMDGVGQCPWCGAHTASVCEDGRWECGSCDAIGKIVENADLSGLTMLSNENVKECATKETIH